MQRIKESILYRDALYLRGILGYTVPKEPVNISLMILDKNEKRKTIKKLSLIGDDMEQEPD